MSKEILPKPLAEPEYEKSQQIKIKTEQDRHFIPFLGFAPLMNRKKWSPMSPNIK
jgi:hypothetical protein